MRATQGLAALVWIPVFGLSAANGQPAAAQPAAEKYPGWAALDRVLHQAAARGTTLYNQQQHQAAYEHFDGTLRPVLVLLQAYQKTAGTDASTAGLGKLIERVTSALDRSTRPKLNVSDKAFLLRGAIDDIRYEPYRPGGWATQTKTLAERLGKESFRDLVRNTIPAVAREAMTGLPDASSGGGNPSITDVVQDALGKQSEGELASMLKTIWRNQPDRGRTEVLASYTRAFADRLCKTLRSRGIPEPEIEEVLGLFKGLKLTYSPPESDDE